MGKYELPRHGLEILPLDGTMTPMPNGDYLWRQNDHGKTRRELERRSKLDAESLRRIRQVAVGRDVPLRQADSRHDSA